jgi:hypothetical protein
MREVPPTLLGTQAPKVQGLGLGSFGYRISVLVLLLCTARLLAQPGDFSVREIPAGYHLQAYDDCGVIGHQPHVSGDACHVFGEGEVAADERARTVTFGTPNFDMVFGGLAAEVPYVLAITYASEKGNGRVQSLSAGSTVLQAKHRLPDGKAERLFFKLPPESIPAGRLTLHFILDQGPNAVVSEVGLWAPLSSPKKLNLDLTPLVSGKLTGLVSDLAYQGLADVPVEITDEAGAWRKASITQSDGTFEVDLSAYAHPPAMGHIRVVARHQGLEAVQTVSLSELYMELPSFMPMSTRVGGLKAPELKLDGLWRIHPSPPTNFQAMPTTGAGWSNLVVPGQFLQQGFDIPRDQDAAVATRFTIPAAWAGKRIFLRFEAVHGRAHYWLNGQSLGVSENVKTPVEFDVTAAARVGQENHLALSLRLQTTSEKLSYVSDYAFHNAAGIDRSVCLFALPPVHLAGFHHQTLLDSSYRDATLTLNFSLQNTTSAAETNLFLNLELRSPAGRKVDLPGGQFTLPTVGPGRTNFSWRIPVATPLKWNAEKPCLYRLTARLVRGSTMLEELAQNVGFRTVEVRDNQLWVNGRRVKLAGTCRHEIGPLTGRAATATYAWKDVALFRSANLNYVRTSHYPPTREFLDACDALGMYVEVEAPFCWVRGRGEDDARLATYFLIPTAAMLEFDRDHPSVIIWSLGNESGSGPDGPNRLPRNFNTMLELCHQQDPSRPVIFNNEWGKDGGAADIECLHYPPLPVEEYSFVKNDPRPRPVLLDEYTLPQPFITPDELNINPGLDAVCWSGQNNPQSLWSQLYHSTRAIGGAFWAGIDEEFYFRDGRMCGYGPWGVIDVWRRPKSLWWDCKCIYSPVWIPVRKLDFAPGQTSVRVPVENRFSFTDLRELTATAAVGVRQKTRRFPLPPQTSGELAIPIPGGATNGSLLVLRFFDAHNRLITAHGIRLGSAPAPTVPKLCAGRPQWAQDDQTIRVHGRQFTLALDRATGALLPAAGLGSTNRSAYQRLPFRLLKLPALHVTRHEDKNPFNPNGLPYATYPDPNSRAIESLTAEERPEGLAIIVHEHYDHFQGRLELLLDNDANGMVSFDYTSSGEAFKVAEAGLRWFFDRDCQEIAWRRQSEWDVCPDDHIGRAEGHARARVPHTRATTAPPPYLSAPAWPWHLDANEMGTRDFRATKYNVCEAALLAPDGAGIRVYSGGSANIRPCLAGGCVQLHTLLAAPPTQFTRTNHLSGTFTFRLLAGTSRVQSRR